jgi:hypothetical protein
MVAVPFEVKRRTKMSGQLQAPRAPVMTREKKYSPPTALSGPGMVVKAGSIRSKPWPFPMSQTRSPNAMSVPMP